MEIHLLHEGVVKSDQKINFQSQKKLGKKQETADWT